MTPAELKHYLADGQPKRVFDVRTRREFAALHVQGVDNLPLDQLTDATVARHFPDKDQKIVFLCKSGLRSNKAAELLKKHGYLQVDCVDGGTDLCALEGLDIVRGAAVMSLERQVRIAAGSLVLLGVVLGVWVNPGFLGLAAFVGAGLVFAGLTDTCGMAMLLAKMPWNR